MDCWDAARTMNVQEAYEKTVHCYRLSMRMLKIATYVVLNIGVLLTALVSKGALLLDDEFRGQSSRGQMKI